MAKEKKKGFLARALGLKSKEEKLAEAAAEQAAQQKQLDEQMTARMVAINAAALKSARQQDEAALGLTQDGDMEALNAQQAAARKAELAAIEAQERRQAELQAAKDVERAKQLAEEKERRAQESERAAKLEDKRAAEAKQREADLARAQEKAEAQLAKDKAEREKQAAQAEAEAKAKLEQARAQQSAKEAAELEAKLASEKSAREAELLRAAQDEQAQAQARLSAEREQAEARAQEKAKAQAAQLEREREKRLAAEAQEAERRALEAERRARAETAQKEREEKAAQISAQQDQMEPQADDGPDVLAKGGFLSRISRGLSKSTSKMSSNMSALFTQRKLDDEAIEDLEDLLIGADLGVNVASQVATRLAEDKFDKNISDMEIKIALADVISDILTPLERPIVLSGAKPEIMLFVGVNGSGKTTTLGKLAKRYHDQGKKVMLAAGDTFRAAAVEQLTIWGERAGAPVISGKPNADAAGLVYDAIEQAKAQDIDILMIDTAGRLQNRTELMEELSKVVRVIKKQDQDAPHHCILVLDATVGQNALMQTQAFTEIAGVSGLVMTKLDGTAKGGVLVALSDKFKLPIHHIGIGERIEDLENFSAPVFASALSGLADSVLKQQ